MKTTHKKVGFNQLVVNYADNVRLAEKYDVTKLKRDIADAGGILQPLLVFPEKGTDRLHVFGGFRRCKAIEEINQGIEADANADIKKEIEEENIPFHPVTEVPVLIYENISDEQLEMIRCDHMSVKGLSDYEQYLAAKRLFRTGLSEDRVGRHLHKSRGWAQERKMLARLAVKYPWLEEQFRLKSLNQKNNAPSFSEIRALATLDNDGKTDELDKKITNLKEGKDSTIPKKKVRPYGKIEEQLKLTRNKGMQAVLRWCMGEEVNLGDFDDPNPETEKANKKG